MGGHIGGILGFPKNKLVPEEMGGHIGGGSGERRGGIGWTTVGIFKSVCNKVKVHTHEKSVRLLVIV